MEELCRSAVRSGSMAEGTVLCYSAENFDKVISGWNFVLGEPKGGYGIPPRRDYKDTVFRMLFSDRKELLALYNAVNDTSYTNPDDLEITTLENAIYMTVKNDVSCVLDMRLAIYEHQSTVNPNMPLRDLDYVTKCFGSYIVRRDIYLSKAVDLPNPKFIVFYNGSAPQPERREYRLSDLYHHREENPSLELVVIQLNLNQGYNEELKKKCPTLNQYMQYVDRVRKYQKEMPLDEAVERAVNECIREGTLADFLLKNKAEVMSMSIYEYDEELHMKNVREEAYEEGRNAAIELSTKIMGKIRDGIVDNAAIAEYCGCTVEEVQSIRKAFGV